MASNTTKQKKKGTSARGGAKKTSSAKRKPAQSKKSPEQGFLRDEIVILIAICVSILMMLSNFGLGGFLGDTLSGVLFGIFGVAAYVIPVVFFIGTAFAVSNKGNRTAYVKIGAGIVLTCLVCTFIQLMMSGFDRTAGYMEYYTIASRYKTDGGVIGGFFAKLLCPAIGVAGTFVLIVMLAIICIVVITERSFLKGVKEGGRKAYSNAKEDAKRRRETAVIRREERAMAQEEALERRREELAAKEAKRAQKKEQAQKQQVQIGDPQTAAAAPIGGKKNRKIVSGVSFATTLSEEAFVKKTPEMKEITPAGGSVMSKMPESAVEERKDEEPDFVINRAVPAGEELPKDIPENSMADVNELFGSDRPEQVEVASVADETGQEQAGQEQRSENSKEHRRRSTKESRNEVEAETLALDEKIQKEAEEPKKIYAYPPYRLLKKGSRHGGDSDTHLRETAMKLQQTLQNFGVNVHVTNVSCGPSVTRYELQPEQGVKVSKIVGLADDIKLNLAAADIRIEAPIPGKAAVGIEVPNKENVAVMLRDLLESEEFKNHPSKIAFAVGRDIAGKVVVADIKKMPHLLIAGATGSGKSVCINTLIMSILYKADPADVKLIMIDPKVVELSVYNGIPHLMIPVVTDPKKAAGALNWAVVEMEKRYQLFAQYNVRDLNGYNTKVEGIKDIDDPAKPKKMPQIVIIVDELADLMMVAPGEVEEAICRLAQLARAAGIHLVLATQRPSVNVITGLIKANMPSRIAFSVSSGVDSRTIIDMNGAEKLLGKGDMLFYPSGYQKPVRVQGSFVSDQEVQSVVDYLVNENGNATYNEEITNHVNTSSTGAGMGSGSGDDRDVYFMDAAKFIIEKDKASIGMLQRVFKIGFNRAARIMDQLAEAGVVGEEEGTKPRKVLMSMEQFEQYAEEYL